MGEFDIMWYVLLVVVGSVVLRVLFPPQPSTHVVYMPMMPIEETSSGGAGFGLVMVGVIIVLLIALTATPQ